MKRVVVLWWSASHAAKPGTYCWLWLISTWPVLSHLRIAFQAYLQYISVSLLHMPPSLEYLPSGHTLLYDLIKQGFEHAALLDPIAASGNPFITTALRQSL